MDEVLIDAAPAPIESRPEPGRITLASPGDLDRYLDAPKVFKLGEKDGRRDDRDEELFIAEECYDQFLSAVQQGRCAHPDVQAALGRRIRYTEDTTFEGYLRDMLGTLKWRRGELDLEHARGHLDQHYRQQCLELIEWSECAIRKFLEKSERKRLIGV